MKKNKSKNKKTAFPANEVMMMLEQMSDGIAVIAEQGNENFKKLDDFKSEMTEFKSEMTEFKSEMTEFKSETNGKLDNLQNDVTEIKYKLSEKVDRDEFRKLEKVVFAKL